jgi:hypothetical protein
MRAELLGVVAALACQTATHSATAAVCLRPFIPAVYLLSSPQGQTDGEGFEPSRRLRVCRFSSALVGIPDGHGWFSPIPKSLFRDPFPKHDVMRSPCHRFWLAAKLGAISESDGRRLTVTAARDLHKINPGLKSEIKWENAKWRGGASLRSLLPFFSL